MKLSDREFKATMIFILEALMEKRDNIDKQMGNFRKDENFKKKIKWKRKKGQ